MKLIETLAFSVTPVDFPALIQALGSPAESAAAATPLGPPSPPVARMLNFETPSWLQQVQDAGTAMVGVPAGATKNTQVILKIHNEYP